MDVTKGKISIVTAYEGSKSEGKIAVLTTVEGEDYTLYRSGRMPQGDTFFVPMDGKEADVTGSIEDNGYICVESVTTADGTIYDSATYNPTQVVSKPIFISVNEDNPQTPEPPKEHGKKKRLPRKIKKQLKKQSKNIR